MQTYIKMSCLHLPSSCYLCLHPPTPLGVGIKGGCEDIIHATFLKFPPRKCCCFFLYFSSAFNNISREAMFREIRQHTPTLSAWMESCYSCQPLLLLGDDYIHSCCGVQGRRVYLKNCIPNNGDITKSSFSQFFFCFFFFFLFFSLRPCVSKNIKSSNLKLCIQVGFHDGSCSHMLIFRTLFSFHGNGN